MADMQVSPISQLLHTLGLTREDLSQRSDQMRQFLTADDAMFSRVLERENSYGSRSGSDIRSSSRSVGSSRSLARSLSRASSNSLRDMSPPSTPVKSEPHEGGMLHRHMDSMEMVLERQRRQRRSRRGKERESSRSMPHPPSPSPSNASQSGLSLDSFMQSRDDLRVLTAVTEPIDGLETVEPPPVTPQKNKYYREHTSLGPTSQPRKGTPCNTETSTPTRPSTETPFNHHPPLYYAYPAYMTYTHYLPIPNSSAQLSSSTPMTPQAHRTLELTRKEVASSLPPSSPSSPQSSPTRFNLVSSPGPMGPLPKEEEYDNLPYTLPPGPYSPRKPDLSYAALVGRAILSSPDHRLTLQEIYDWMTIVYPHYKRGETTWMNSIRHVLSTTVCFRKVPRDRAVGRTLWAIWDDDLPCFKDGGFKKHLCKEYTNSNEGKEKATGFKGKPRMRKRVDDDDIIDGRKAKRVKKDQVATSSSKTSLVATSLSSHLLFPPTRPTPHHQPYYESCMPQPQILPAEVIFPPLPATSAFNRVVNLNASSSACETTIPKARATPPSSSQFPSSSSSSSSIPDLTPNRNSSSPPSSLPATSDMEVDSRPLSAKDDDCLLVDVSGTSSNDGPEADEPSGEDSVFNTALLGPVRFWGNSPKASTTLQPGIELFNFDSISEDDDDTSRHDVKGKQKLVSRNTKNIFLPVPTSPTPNHRAKRKKSNDANRPVTPPPILAMPCTPPRKTNQRQISSIRTPLSHKGLHMSPTASLAHYKSNLDPPPLYNRGQATDNAKERDDEAVDPMQTPRKRGSKADTSSFYEPPVTPQKLIFPSGLDDSPFRTPIRGLGASPFRTPGSRNIIDPHDPRTLLDEELNRIGNSYGDSPAGLFGKGRGSLLYDSPGLDSPGKWSKWW